MADIPEARKLWYQLRKEAIHRYVSAYDILRGNGIDIKQAADETEEQISCPFHGADKKPSARVYPNDNNSQSHVWCFVCQQPGWDCIGLYRMFNGGYENCSFTEALTGLEKEYGLDPPPLPDGAAIERSQNRVPSKEEAGIEGFKKLYTTCERRLKSCQYAYRSLGDMHGYLAAGSILDKVKSRVDRKLWDTAKGSTTLTQLLEKIQEKVNACPEG